MTLVEAKNSINAVIQASHDYESSINSLQSELLALADAVNTSNSSIASGIDEATIVESSNNTASQIISSINESISMADSALSTLSNDANKKIREIVDAYNSSLDSESKEERLSYQEISLSGIGGSASLSGSGGAIKSGNSLIKSKSSKDDSEYYGAGFTSEEEEKKEITKEEKVEDSSDVEDSEESTESFDLNYYLGQLGTLGIDSDNISNWNTEIYKFLVQNGLEKYVKGIQLKGSTIKCTLSNGTVHNINNITTKEALLERLNRIIKGENLMA